MLISWNEAEDHQDPKRQNEHSTYSVLGSLLLLCISSRTCHHRFISLALYCFLQVRYIVRVTIFMADLPIYTGSLILFPLIRHHARVGLAKEQLRQVIS